MYRKLLVAFFALFLLPVLALAQDGKLRGTITDRESGEPLIGANVIIDGTSLGASTDINGEYIILSVPPGVYTVKASYIGYAAVTISNIRVSSNITTTQDIKLSSTAIQVQAVEVVADPLPRSAEHSLVECRCRSTGWEPVCTRRSHR